MIQETVLARNLCCICGSDLVTWVEMSLALIFLTKAANLSVLFDVDLHTKTMNNAMLRVFQRISRGTESWHMRPLFLAITECHATDPKDYVYGILGLTNLKIDPDYDLTVAQVYSDYARAWICKCQRLDLLTVAQVYSDYARAWICKCQRLDLLTYASTTSTFANIRTKDVPSWVPDWRSLPEGFLASLPDQQSASGSSTAKEVSADLTTLSVRGVRCDNVHVCVPVLTGEREGFEQLADYAWSLFLDQYSRSLPARSKASASSPLTSSVEEVNRSEAKTRKFKTSR